MKNIVKGILILDDPKDVCFFDLGMSLLEDSDIDLEITSVARQQFGIMTIGGSPSIDLRYVQKLESASRKLKSLANKCLKDGSRKLKKVRNEHKD